MHTAEIVCDRVAFIVDGRIVEEGRHADLLGLEQEYTGRVDIIYGLEEFENFELSLEWKLPEGGNSGIFYHLKEGFNGPGGICPEYQLIDDLNYENIHDLTAYNTSLGYENPAPKAQLFSANCAFELIENVSINMNKNSIVFFMMISVAV